MINPIVTSTVETEKSEDDNSDTDVESERGNETSGASHGSIRGNGSNRNRIEWIEKSPRKKKNETTRVTRIEERLRERDGEKDC